MKFNPKSNPDAERIMRGLYEFKKSLVERNKAFSKEEFLSGLREIGIPSNMHFWYSILHCDLPTQKCKLLTRVTKNGYVFTKPKEPIFHGDLQAIYDFYKEMTTRYHRTYKEKKSKETTLDEVLFGSPKISKEGRKTDATEHQKEEFPKEIQNAINLLKSNGFEILAPVAILYTKV